MRRPISPNEHQTQFFAEAMQAAAFALNTTAHYNVYIQVASTLVKDALTDEDKILMWHDPITKKEVRAPEDARTIAPKNKIWQAWEGKLDLSLLYLTTAGILVSLKDRSGTYKLTPKGEAMRTELLAQSFYTSIKKGGTK